MDKKIMKIMPIVFILILIASIINSLDIDLPSKLSTGILYTETLVTSLIMEFLIFYYDYKKNKSAVSIIGLLGIALYIIISIVYLVISNNSIKNLDMNSLQSYMKLSKAILNIEETITYVIDMLKYFSMLSIMNHKTNNQIATISQIGVYLSSFVYYMINIGLVFVTEKTPDFIRIISKTSYRLINICIFTFVIYQLFAEEELKLAQVAEEKPKEAPNPQAFQTNGPRFRNPALEAQQARLAQQQNQQQPMNNQMGQNQFQQSSISQPTMTGQPMMSEQMLNQPPIVNQQQPMNNQMNNNNSINNL
ncbi:MAG: hypothetical protein IJJ63_02655 [Bacilli bacterium]|nr:hypothetical protein [Bacilli bacterium]